MTNKDDVSNSNYNSTRFFSRINFAVSGSINGHIPSVAETTTAALNRVKPPPISRQSLFFSLANPTFHS